MFSISLLIVLQCSPITAPRSCSSTKSAYFQCVPVIFEWVTHPITFIKKAEALDEPHPPTKRTSVDRSKSSRAVPMEVMCLGMPRTGTSCPFPSASSLYSHDAQYSYRAFTKKGKGQTPLLTCLSAIREALILLGYDDCYHMASCTKEKPKDCRVWCDALDGKMGIRPPFEKEEWDMLLGHCRVCRNPCVSESVFVDPPKSTSKVVVT